MSSYNSFYGGRRGASFVIVKKYATIKEMVAEFSKGGDYKTVNYDEYVLIDTENKNNPDNGKIFRRGYEYNNDMGGAIYMGQIVGPGGLAPHLQMETIKDVLEAQETEGFTYRRGQGEYSPDENLIPGKYIDESGFIHYNDKITWAYCSVRDEFEKDTIAHIGFKIPYHVAEYEANSVDPYYNRNNSEEGFINENLIERIDDKKHPFYSKWLINIPKGIKGDALKNLRVVYANTGIQDYDGKQDDIDNARQVLVYTYYKYDKNPDGEPVDIYLGDYNMIENISIEDDGTLNIEYSHDNKSTFSKRIKWIDKVSMDNQTGQISIHYNTGVIQKVDNYVNFILKTACNKDTAWHLYILYSDPNQRGKISYDGRNDWTDLGYIGNGEIGCIAAKEDDESAKTIINQLPPYSTWMIIED